jgi:hypothetical protein
MAKLHSLPFCYLIPELHAIQSGGSLDRCVITALTFDNNEHHLWGDLYLAKRSPTPCNLNLYFKKPASQKGVTLWVDLIVLFKYFPCIKYTFMGAPPSPAPLYMTKTKSTYILLWHKRAGAHFSDKAAPWIKDSTCYPTPEYLMRCVQKRKKKFAKYGSPFYVQHIQLNISYWET